MIFLNICILLYKLELIILDKLINTVSFHFYIISTFILLCNYIILCIYLYLYLYIIFIHCVSCAYYLHSIFYFK